MSDCVKGFGCRPLKDRGHKQGGRRPKIFKGNGQESKICSRMKHCDCSPFARPASFAQLAMAAYTPLLAIETIPSPFCSGADILPLTMGRFAPEADLQARDVARPEYEEPTLRSY